MADLIQLRGGSANLWTLVNPTLADREMGIETDTKKLKLGDGVTPWNNLLYLVTGAQDISYEHVQAIAQTQWTIAHNLNKYPSVIVVDSDGSGIECDITYININTVQLNFSTSFSGKAYLN